MQSQLGLTHARAYEITLHGYMDMTNFSWIDSSKTVNIMQNATQTILSNVVVDQASLIHIIRRFHAMTYVIVQIKLCHKNPT